MDERFKLKGLEGEEKIKPHAYLKSISNSDIRWERVVHFWQLPLDKKGWLFDLLLRKLRSKQVMVAILNGQYWDGNIEINVDLQERIINFSYRGTNIGKFHQKLMTFVPVHADIFEGTYSTVGQRKSAKSAVKEIVQTIFGDSAADRISLAYKEFLVLLFGSIPRQPSDLLVSREAYINTMNIIEEKYRLEAGDADFLEWRLTLLGRSPMFVNEKTKEELR
ncbi:hypothetical protein [Paenibacillus paeoniae]|uniref:Uncharacterized protein n=1 Tax=Paenibacillus paeoniae TaxID=2292705 RepID=A0A371P7R1_9BACL|nr:hypothetical protein [Paenibacillus paeoniae]REK71496.1 hypothetical protein DX130_21080 [Paenibacillus paeoniae]